MNTAGVTAFACGCGWIATTSLGLILKHYSASRGAIALCLLTVTAFLLTRGIRPEVPGLALLLLGAAVSLGGGRWALIGSMSLVASSAQCHPFLALLALPVLLWIARRHITHHQASLSVVVGSAIVAAVLNLLLFLAMINGQWSAFWHDFFRHAHFVRPSPSDRWTIYVNQWLLGWERWPNLIVVIGTLALSACLFIKNPGSRKTLAFAGAALLWLLVLGYAAYTQFSVAFVVLACALISAISVSSTPRARRLLTLIPALTLSLWIGLQLTLQTLADRSAPAPVAALQTWLGQHAPTDIGIDAYTLRHAFDYNPPGIVHLLDWNDAPDSSPRWNNPSALGERDVWIANPLSLPSLRDRKTAFSPLSVFGRPLRSVRAYSAVLLILGPALPPPSSDSGIQWVRSSTLGDTALIPQ
jgi:hypothetical protein